MSYEKLLHACDCVSENMEYYGATWNSWDSALDICTTYSVDLTADERDTLERAIKSNGHTLLEDLLRHEREALGQNFHGSRAEKQGDRAMTQSVK